MKYLEFKIDEEVLRAATIDREGFIRETNAKMKELIEKAWKSFEPCAHEPDTLADHGYHVWLCRCGAKIKAEKWVEV